MLVPVTGPAPTTPLSNMLVARLSPPSAIGRKSYPVLVFGRLLDLEFEARGVSGEFVATSSHGFARRWPIPWLVVALVPSEGGDSSNAQGLSGTGNVKPLGFCGAGAPYEMST